MRESHKKQAIGALAGGIAHDFNNIATILGNAELARQDASANPLALESMDEIRKAGSRARPGAADPLLQPQSAPPSASRRRSPRSSRSRRACCAPPCPIKYPLFLRTGSEGVRSGGGWHNDQQKIVSGSSSWQQQDDRVWRAANQRNGVVQAPAQDVRHDAAFALSDADNAVPDFQLAPETCRLQTAAT